MSQPPHDRGNILALGVVGLFLVAASVTVYVWFGRQQQVTGGEERSPSAGATRGQDLRSRSGVVVSDSLIATKDVAGVRFSGTTTATAGKETHGGSTVGAIDLRTGDAHLTTEYRDDPTLSTEILVADGIQYLRPLGDHRWTPMAPSQNTLLSPADLANPIRVLAALETGSALQSEGTGSVRGESCDKYRASLPSESLFTGPDTESEADVLRLGLCFGGTDLVRQLTLHIEDTVGGQPITTDTTIEYYDYDAHIRVEPPDDRDIIAPTIPEPARSKPSTG